MAAEAEAAREARAKVCLLYIASASAYDSWFQRDMAAEAETAREARAKVTLLYRIMYISCYDIRQLKLP